MIGYADKTWCRYSNECADGDTCFRAFTDKDHEKAVKWWGNADYPICVYVTKPECFREKQDAA